jgi:hypothetical protein
MAFVNAPVEFFRSSMGQRAVKKTTIPKQSIKGAL